MISHCNSQ